MELLPGRYPEEGTPVTMTGEMVVALLATVVVVMAVPLTPPVTLAEAVEVVQV